MQDSDALIRPARLDDAESLHRHCYPQASLDDVRDYLGWCLRQTRKGWILRLVAEVEGQVVGNIQLTVWGQEGEIGSLVVAEAFRHRGLARRMLGELIDEAKRRELAALEIGVSERQPALLAFYRQLGFCPTESTEKAHFARGPRFTETDSVFGGVTPGTGQRAEILSKKREPSHSASPEPIIHLRMQL